MIQAVFELGSEKIISEVDGNNLVFLDASNMTVAPLEGLRLDKNGVLEEFPDLREEKEWRKIAIERFKEHMAHFQTEDEKIDYIIQELRKCGYTPLFKQRAGWRPERIR